MKRTAGIIAVAIVLLAVGGVLLAAGFFERRMAVAQEDMAVLDFVDPAAEYAALEQDIEKYRWLSADPAKEIRYRRALLQYWQRDYEDLIEVARAASQNENAGAIDPEMQVLAANALYRVAQHGPRDRATLLKNLDAAIRAYADALRAGSERSDVAFNYELAIRRRQEVVAARGRTPTDDVDVEGDENMHGDPGEPPKEMKVEQFQIRIPMDSQEIKQRQDTAGAGPQRRRRG